MTNYDRDVSRLQNDHLVHLCWTNSRHVLLVLCGDLSAAVTEHFVISIFAVVTSFAAVALIWHLP